MPYIDGYRREDLNPLTSPHNAGELNYVITYIVNEYLGNSYGYSDINEVIGVLECAKLELYRRIASPYEDEKIQQNGDVYGVLPE